MGDKEQLLKIFNNLLENSIEAGDAEATMTRIDIRLTMDDSVMVIEVSDNAMGIDESLREKIFVPNFTTKSSGTGLGLAFVKQAIGTTFFLSFPIVY
jgi:two-component system nitrogen regulation sensor histidine kinase NtrY